MKLSSKNWVVLGAAVVVIGAIVGAVVVYQRSARTVNSSTGTGTVTKDFVGADMGIASSPTKADQYNDLIKNEAVTSSTIKISGCQPTPQVVSVKIGEEVTVQNEDSTQHVLVNGNILNVTLPPKGKATFSLKPGIPAPAFNYACDGTTVGAILVVGK